MKKRCRRCGVDKPLEEFYEHSKMFDGHLNVCKECTRKRVALYAKTPAGKEVERRRGTTDRRRKAVAQRQKIKRVENSKKFKARAAVNNAIRDGRMSKKPCEECGVEKVHAHHDDYGAPLVVRWLCGKHHRAIHPEFKSKY